MNSIYDVNKIELLNDYDAIRNDSIILDRLNDLNNYWGNQLLRM